MNGIDVAIVGGGPAGLAAALAARRVGATRILLLERDNYLGGILQQCVHTGFGTQIFMEDLTGPEYAERFIAQVQDMGVQVKLDTAVLEVTSNKVMGINTQDGLFNLEPKAIVLAMGCRERPRGALLIPGTRPAGIFTSGTAQRYVNILGYVPGKRAVVLGSGDVGLIMARRLTLEGAKVEAVVEIMPYPGGLTRNVIQCLLDYDIPLLLRHTVTQVHGKKRIEGVTVAETDEQLRPIPKTERFIPCDTLLLSAGLIPENELSRKAGICLDPATGGPIIDETFETSLPGVFACGNVVHVHDLVDHVTEEGYTAGRYAALRAIGGSQLPRTQEVIVRGLRNVRYVVPHRLRWDIAPVRLVLRVQKPEDKVVLRIRSDEETLLEIPMVNVRPGELVTADLPKQVLDKLEGSKNLSVSVETEDT